MYAAMLERIEIYSTCQELLVWAQGLKTMKSPLMRSHQVANEPALRA